MSFRQLAVVLVGATFWLYTSVNSLPLGPQVVKDCARNYTVQANDTCDSISAQQNVSTFQLSNVNQGVISPGCNNLFVGESLCLGILGHDCTTVHVIHEGESCGSIVAAAGINLATLAANNPNINPNCSNIYPKEVLCTAASIIN